MEAKDRPIYILKESSLPFASQKSAFKKETLQNEGTDEKSY